MKKYSFLVYHNDYEDFLQNVRELGVVHLIERKQEISEEIRDQYQLIDRVDKVIRFLKKREVQATESGNNLNGQEVFEKISGLQAELEQLNHHLVQVDKEINDMRPWGDFSRDTLRKLSDNGVRVRFFISTSRKFESQWLEDYPIEIISESGGNVYFILVEHDHEELDVPAEEIKLHKHSLSKLKDKKKEIITSIADTGKKFDDYAATAIPSLEKYKDQLIQDVDYDKAVYHTDSEVEDKLRVLEGWVPKDRQENLNTFLETTSVVYVVSDATPDQKVPIKLKNNNFAKKFQVIGELYSMPKYGELDMTPFFAPFYALFFGFCLGDAGYGILIVVASLIAKRKVSLEMKPITVLLFYLGLSTIFFGVISGTFFGIDLYATDLPVYSSMSQYLAAKDTDVSNLLFYLSLILGGIQILFGLILRTINETIQFGWKLAVGTMGWVFLIVGLLVITAISRFGGIEMESLNPALYVIIGISGVMILLLNNLKRNILINLGVGLWNSYNMITGIVGDLLSYIRLFALGISSAILGYVFNSLAVSLSGSIPVVSIIIMIIILVIGHSLNLFMSGLGSFVHPMRLTFVEFYKNAGFAGGGKKYHPFKKIV